MKSLNNLTITAFLIALVALTVPAMAQSPQVQPAQQCSSGHTWMETSYGGACFPDVEVPSLIKEHADELQRYAEIKAKQDAINAAEMQRRSEFQRYIDAFYAEEAQKDKKTKTVTVQVVDTEASAREYSYYIPGTNGYSTTNCNANATAATYGGITTANGTGTCNSTSTPGRPAMIGTRSIPQSNVHAIMADGTHVTLWCQAGFRRCANLSPGSYKAKIDGNSVWMFADELGGKEHKIKYHWTGSW